jgi:hypothetical protein
VYAKHAKAFRDMFGVSLSRFWDPMHGGFLLRDFCTQVIMYDGDEPGVATAAQFGRDGRAVIRHLMHDMRMMW